MANKRMFSVDVVASDIFLDMPPSTRALYFHLGVVADDDGFVNNPHTTQRLIGASDDDLKLLIAKRLLIPFASGVVAIRHWRLNNYIRADRYRPTQYQDEYSQLLIRNNGVYSLKTDEPYSPNISGFIEPESIQKHVGIPHGIPSVNQTVTQYRLDKSRLEELRTQQQQQLKILSIFKNYSLSNIAKVESKERNLIEKITEHLVSVYFGREPQMIDTARIYGYLLTIWQIIHSPEKAPALTLLSPDDDEDEGNECRERVDDTLELLNHAFEMSSKAEKPSFEYIEMVIASYRKREVKSAADVYDREFQRDIAKGKI